MVYSAGNFIEATEDTPFFQIGEHKYGKPILDRVLSIEDADEEVVKAVCVSMDSTLRSNLSVGMPLDFAVMRRDSYTFDVRQRIEADDPRFMEISRHWGDALRNAFASLAGHHGAVNRISIQIVVEVRGRMRISHLLALMLSTVPCRDGSNADDTRPRR